MIRYFFSKLSRDIIKTSPTTSITSLPRRRRWLFRIAAILLGFTPVLMFEAGLRIMQWQPILPASDPFVEFESVRPLFVLGDDGSTMVTAANRLDYFRPESFPKIKPSGTGRIVCLGGSTVQGRPYAIETSFTTWLELSLAATDPQRSWDVINCGGVSYASYRLVPIVQEMLQYEPDLIVLYTGHNEFLEDRHYRNLTASSSYLTRSLGLLTELKCVQWTRQLAGPLAGVLNQPTEAIRDQYTLAAEVDTLLDYQGGLEFYQRDPDWRRSVTEHFELNLRRMIQCSREANVPILVVDPPVNLRDCPPFKSVPEARDRDVDRSDAASLRAALAKDPGNAANHFLLATYLASAGDHVAAKHHFERAVDEDVCPLRIIGPLREVIHQVTQETGTPLVPARQRFEAVSEGGIPGKRLFVDHVHPAFHGHQWIAEYLIEQLVSLNTITPPSDWQSSRDALYEQHWLSLDVVYFERGKQRLEGLQLWSQGRGKKIRSPKEYRRFKSPFAPQ